MTDEVYRSRKKVGPEDIGPAPEASPMDRVRQMQEALSEDTGDDAQDSPMARPDSSLQMSGNIPEAFRKVLEQKGAKLPQGQGQGRMPQPKAKAPNLSKTAGSDELETLLQKIGEKHVPWEDVELPSQGKFYDGIPGTLHIRPMTGEEEQILATPRHVRKGRAIDMIFEKCIREASYFNTEDLLSADRTYLLIYLRGISYTPEYDVEIKCPVCSTRFNTVIDLNGLDVDACPEDFTPNSLSGTLPTTGFRFQYHLASGADEQAVTRYRDTRLKEFGDQNDDDTLLYRTALLIDRIEGVTDRNEINVLLKKLPINDVAYLRNVTNDVPFGVLTEVGQVCASCGETFEIELPMEANFFFPKKKEKRTQA